MKQNFVKKLIAIVAIVTAWGGHTYAMTPPTTPADTGGSPTYEQSDYTPRCPQISTESCCSVKSLSPCCISDWRVAENISHTCVLGSPAVLLKADIRCGRSHGMRYLPHLDGLHKPVEENYVVIRASWTYYRSAMGQYCYLSGIYTMEWRDRYVYAQENERYRQRSVGKLERRIFRHLTGKEVAHV